MGPPAASDQTGRTVKIARIVGRIHEKGIVFAGLDDSRSFATAR